MLPTEIPIPLSFERFDWHENRGFYLLLFTLERSEILSIGRLGKCRFDPGLYCYVGSAKRNLRQRIRRHCSSDKPMRWHIDPLTLIATIRAVVPIPWAGHSECEIANSLVRKEWRRYPKGFGASDCRCKGHLLYLDTKES